MWVVQLCKIITVNFFIFCIFNCDIYNHENFVWYFSVCVCIVYTGECKSFVKDEPQPEFEIKWKRKIKYNN